MSTGGIFEFATRVMGMQARGELDHFLLPAVKLGRRLTGYRPNPLETDEDLERMRVDIGLIKHGVVELLEYLAELPLWPEEAEGQFESAAVGFQRYSRDLSHLLAERVIFLGEPSTEAQNSSLRGAESPPEGSPFTKSPGVGDEPAPGASISNDDEPEG